MTTGLTAVGNDGAPTFNAAEFLWDGEQPPLRMGVLSATYPRSTSASSLRGCANDARGALRPSPYASVQSRGVVHSIEWSLRRQQSKLHCEQVSVMRPACNDYAARGLRRGRRLAVLLVALTAVFMVVAMMTAGGDHSWRETCDYHRRSLVNDPRRY